MTNLFKRFFGDRTLYYKLTVAFVLATMIPMLLLAYTSYMVIDSRLYREAGEKLDMGMKTAWAEYKARGEQMRYGMLQAALQGEISNSIYRGDSKYLKEMMIKWKEKRPYVDIWIIVDNKGKVISRLNGEIKDDLFEVNGLVETALTSGKTFISTEILSEDILDREGEVIHKQFAPLINPEDAGDRFKEGDDMALMVVTPVLDGSQKPVGAIITGDVLNNDTAVPDVVSNRFPWLSASIVMNGMRISTNIKGNNGRTANFTLLPSSFMEKITLGKQASGNMNILDSEFITLADPIRNSKGKVIGALAVGMPKAWLWDIQKENQKIIAVATLLGLLLASIIAFITEGRITAPLRRLKQRVVALEAGKMDELVGEIVANPDSRDELLILADRFNNMINSINLREKEREEHLKELESKNNQLMELNEKLDSANEKLEVSYEEIQSQTEEVGAANEELRVVNEELEGKIAELKEANSSLIIEKEEKMQMTQRLMQSEKLSSLGEIISGVAHELNNPLATVMGFSELLLGKEHAKGAREQLEIINESSHRCKRIVDNLLTFARSYKPEKSYSDLNMVISGTLDLKQYHLRADNIDVETELDPALPKTMLDEHQFQQVFLNLINNAQHAIAEKENGRGRITITSSSEKDIIRIKISDTGKGIPADVAKKIFDPFFTTKEVGKGTGLGLSISFGIIKEHGGNIFAASKPDEGATFVIELPVVGAPEKAQEVQSPESPANQLAASGLRALVLDDEPNMLGLLKEALSSSGFHVDTTTIGVEALKMLKETSYDLIMSDIKMPGLSGMEFHDRLMAMKPEALDKVIFMTGDSIGKETQDFIKATGKPFLKKPFTMKGLRAEISKHITSLNPDTPPSSTKVVS